VIWIQAVLLVLIAILFGKLLLVLDEIKAALWEIRWALAGDDD
jgi:hypothetical protein